MERRQDELTDLLSQPTPTSIGPERGLCQFGTLGLIQRRQRIVDGIMEPDRQFDRDPSLWRQSSLEAVQDMQTVIDVAQCVVGAMLFTVAGFELPEPARPIGEQAGALPELAPAFQVGLRERQSAHPCSCWQVQRFEWDLALAHVAVGLERLRDRLAEDAHRHADQAEAEVDADGCHLINLPREVSRRFCSSRMRAWVGPHACASSRQPHCEQKSFGGGGSSPDRRGCRAPAVRAA